MNAHQVGPDGQPVGQLLRADGGIEERAFVFEDGALAITRWARADGRWTLSHVVTLPAEAAITLAGVLAEDVARRLSNAGLASCGHTKHPRGFGCTHDGCANDSRQFEAGLVPK